MKLKIPTSKGNYLYRFIPIYPGIKPIDKEKAKENLSLLKRICNKHNLDFILFFGTLLGAIREHDFISHDEDIDIVMPISDIERFKDILFILRENGFEVARFERRGFISIIRNGEYIDIYFFSPYTEDKRLTTCICELCEVKYINNTTQMKFQGEFYTIPKESETLLEFLYGKNWRTPIPMFNFKMNRLNRIKAFTIQYIKALLPYAITEIIQDYKSKKRIEFFKQKAYIILNNKIF